MRYYNAAKICTDKFYSAIQKVTTIIRNSPSPILIVPSKEIVDSDEVLRGSSIGVRSKIGVRGCLDGLVSLITESDLDLN